MNAIESMRVRDVIDRILTYRISQRRSHDRAVLDDFMHRLEMLLVEHGPEPDVGVVRRRVTDRIDGGATNGS